MRLNKAFESKSNEIFAGENKEYENSKDNVFRYNIYYSLDREFSFNIKFCNNKTFICMSYHFYDINHFLEQTMLLNKVFEDAQSVIFAGNNKEYEINYRGPGFYNIFYNENTDQSFYINFGSGMPIHYYGKDFT